MTGPFKACIRSSMIFSLMVCIALYTFGVILGKGDRVVVTRDRSGSVKVATRDSKGSEVDAYIDDIVLGKMPGKEIRIWMESGLNPPGVLNVKQKNPRGQFSVAVNADIVALFGSSANYIGNEAIWRSKKLWVIHPTASPPLGDSALLKSQGKAHVVLVLPEIDEIGNGTAWRRWAVRNNVVIVQSPRSGVDIRAAWPEVLTDAAFNVM